MTTTRLPLALAASLAAASLAHAQYAAPAPRADAGLAGWEVDAGLGYVFDTNQASLDNGTALHLGGYKVDAADATRETVLKYGGELYYSSVDGKNSANLDTVFLSADIGMGYKFSRTIEAALTAGVGVGRLSFDSPGGGGDSSNCFGYQIRPEIIFHASERVGISLAYRFLHTFPTDSKWTENPSQQAIELSVKFGF